MASSPEEFPQDALFDVETTGNGATDPENFAVGHHFVMPEDDGDAERPRAEDLPAPEDATVMQLVGKAVHKQNRRAGQLGKHSPVTRGEEPTELRPGDFVPGLGPVTYGNIAAARTWRLDAERNRKRTA